MELEKGAGGDHGNQHTGGKRPSAGTNAKNQTLSESGITTSTANRCEHAIKCGKLLLIDETDRLELWKKNFGGFTYESRNEFLQKKVLIDFDFAERSLADIVAALRRGEKVKLPLAERAQKAGREAVELNPQKCNEHSAGYKNENVTGKRGNKASYRAAKLKRDHPDVAGRLAAGE